MKKRFSVPLLVFIMVFPPLFLLWFSVTQHWPLPDILPSQFNAQHWLSLTGIGRDLLAALGVSLLIAVPVAILSTALGFITARHVAYTRRKDRWLFWAILPFAMSPVILSLCLLYLFFAF